MIESKKLPLLALLVVVAAVLAFLSKGSLSLKPDVVAPAAPPPAVEKAAAAPQGSRTVQLRDGASRNLAQPPGKLFILHFWATWCAPCVEEMPGLLAFLHESKKDPNFEFLAVSVDEDWKIVDGWLKQHGAADLPVALDPRRETAKQFGTVKFPETYVLSPAGEVLLWVKGSLDWKSPAFARQLEALRKHPKAKAAA
jgi:thiol-disulfide isomerase/thioredoxin